MKQKLLSIFILLLLFGCENNDDHDSSKDYGTEDNLITLTSLNSDLRESSGLILMNDLLWSHNDSGDNALIYNISENSPEIYKTAAITNANNSDWEDIAQDNSHLYIGDFGNNSGEREDLSIYKIPKANLPEDTEAEIIKFIFSDQTVFENTSSMHNFDCEAIIATEEHLYLFSKNHLDQQTKLYKLPKEPGTYFANRIDIFDADGLITGAGFDKTSNTLCLLGYNTINEAFHPFIWILYDFNEQDFFGGKTKRVNLPILTQMEGICAKGNDIFLISSENEDGTGPSLYSFDAGKWKE